jgi:hypothetical protein
MLVLSLNQLALGQDEKSYKILTIAFYNLENLFDYHDDPLTWDEDYTPKGRYHWDRQGYTEKLAKLATVISRIGSELTGTPPAIIGVCELENYGVLEDLLNQPPLRKTNYGIVHFDSPDRRGIDTALLYRKELFIPTGQQRLELVIYDEDGKRLYTRDILLVGGMLDGEKMYFMVNHWPSRRGGERKSRIRRVKAAALAKRAIDSIRAIEPYTPLILMGDFNDDPLSHSIKNILETEADPSELDRGDLYNPMEKMYRRGMGSLAWRDNWNLFDQFIVTSHLLMREPNLYRFYKAGIFNQRHLSQSNGKYRGYPFRSFDESGYTGGYSDHFPVFMYLIKPRL